MTLILDIIFVFIGTNAMNIFLKIFARKSVWSTWSLSDRCKQNMYVASCVTNGSVRRRRPNSINHKSTSRQIFLKYGKEDQKRVCLKFLCATLSISHRVFEVCMRDVSEGGIYMGQHKSKGKKRRHLILLKVVM